MLRESTLLDAIQGRARPLEGLLPAAARFALQIAVGLTGASPQMQESEFAVFTVHHSAPGDLLECVFHTAAEFVVKRTSCIGIARELLFTLCPRISFFDALAVVLAASRGQNGCSCQPARPMAFVHFGFGLAKA